MRPILTRLHRWVGLTIAAFLIVSGLTGAVIAWNDELDQLINAHLIRIEETGPSLSPLQLARVVEAADPRVIATYIPLYVEEGQSLAIGIWPRIDPETLAPYEVDYNQVFVNPVTGDIVGKRNWGAVWPVSKETFVSFLWLVHFSLYIPAMWDIEFGMWLMGIVAMLWMVDCFIGFYLTLPVQKSAPVKLSVGRQPGKSWWSRWKPAWQIKWKASAYRINFDFHRAFGLWTWLILFLLAMTGVALNLNQQIAQPIVRLFSSITPAPYQIRQPISPAKRGTPKLGFEEALEMAGAEGRKRGLIAPIGEIYYSPEYDYYRTRFFEAGDSDGVAGGGYPALFLDANDGRFIALQMPWTGTAGDIFLSAQYPIHSGRVAGLAGRIFISVMGIGVAALSITGVVIWERKRRARRLSAAVRNSASAGRQSMPAE